MRDTRTERLAGYVEPSENNWDMAVVRLSPDGSPDAAFGAGGQVVVPFDLASNGFDYASSVVWQADGKLVVGGYAADETGAGHGAVMRLDADGGLDGQFGESGKRTFALVEGNPANTSLEGLALQGSRIIGVGTARDDGDEDPYYQFAVRFAIDLVYANGFEQETRSNGIPAHRRPGGVPAGARLFRALARKLTGG